MKSIVRFFQFVNGTSDLWCLYNRPIDKGTLIFAATDDPNDTELIGKLGDGILKYHELPELFRLSTVASVSKFDIFDIDMQVDHILFIDTDGKIRISNITEGALDSLYAQIHDISFASAVTVLIVNGHDTQQPGDTFTLTAKAISSFFNEGVDIENYEWILPNGSSTNDNPLIYTIPNDSGLIGTTLTFEVKATDELGFSSVFKSVEVDIVMNGEKSLITNAIIELE